MARVGWLALGVAILAALGRPVLWPLGQTDALWAGAPRALVLALAALVGLVLAVGLAARRRPSELVAARALDDALGLPDVVTSGALLAGEGGFVELARVRASAALDGRDVHSLLPLPRIVPRARGAIAGALALALACLVGAYDPALARVLEEPPRFEERASAAALVEALADVSRDARESSPLVEERQLAAEVDRALERGDRERAMEALAALRALGEDRARAADEPRALARRLARHLDAAPGVGLEAQTRLLARQLREDAEAGESGAGGAARERVLERLARSADAAARSGSAEAQRMAEALSRAQAALSEGRAEEAARALEEAAVRAAALDAARSRAEAELDAIARLLERVGAVEGAIQGVRLGEPSEAGGEGAALAGIEPGEGGLARARIDQERGSERLGSGQGGQGGAEGGGLSSALAARLAAIGLAEGPAGAGAGGGGGRAGSDGRPARRGLAPSGDVHARSLVREGEQAVQVLEGLGQNEEARHGYAEIYPSYGAVAEEALASEHIPAARRETIRRYFESIRPGAGDANGAGGAPNGAGAGDAHGARAGDADGAGASEPHGASAGEADGAGAGEPNGVGASAPDEDPRGEGPRPSSAEGGSR